MNDIPSWIAITLSIIAIIISYKSFQAAKKSIKVSIFDRRFEVYEDTEKFISAWMRDGNPDMNLLSTLVGAWSRSHFLFDDSITIYLRKIWLDSCEAALARDIIDGNADGDRKEAIEKKYKLLKEHTDFEKLRDVFKSSLKVNI